MLPLALSFIFLTTESPSSDWYERTAGRYMVSDLNLLYLFISNFIEMSSTSSVSNKVTGTFRLLLAVEPASRGSV